MNKQEMTPRRWRKDYLNWSWSRFQKAIFDWCINGTGHLAVEAVAGSGKTTTIFGIIAALLVDAKIQVIAFNVSVKDKIKNDPRVPQSRVTVSTAHGCGRAMLWAHYRGEPKVDENKHKKLTDKAIQEFLSTVSDYKSGLQHFEIAPPDFNHEDLELFQEAIEKLIEFARLTLTPLNEDLIECAKHYNIKFPGGEKGLHWGIKLTIEILQQGLQLAANYQIIDLTDMLFLPNAWNLMPTGIKDFCIVDEAQDANAAMIGIYRKFVNQGARLIMVGDSFQSIMGFAGADSNSFAKLKAEFNPTELPLSICYRCANSHLELAKKLVPTIEAREDAPEGKIEVISKDKLIAIAQPKNLIICRLTGPLIGLCLQLIVSGKPARVRGRDIGKSIAALARKSIKKKPFQDFKYHFTEYCQLIINKLKAEKDNDELERFQDKVLAVDHCYTSFGRECQTIDEFCERINKLFIDADETGIITLSTIHRAKGDEAETVALLLPDLLPFTHPHQLSWQYQQELHLMYVALTRAQENLYLVAKQDLLDEPLGGLIIPELDNDAQLQDELKPETVEYIRACLESCTTIERLHYLRTIYPANTLKIASKNLSDLKKQQVKAWVIELNQELNQQEPKQLTLNLK